MEQPSPAVTSAIEGLMSVVATVMMVAMIAINISVMVDRSSGRKR